MDIALKFAEPFHNHYPIRISSYYYEVGRGGNNITPSSHMRKLTLRGFKRLAQSHRAGYRRPKTQSERPNPIGNMIF